MTWPPPQVEVESHTPRSTELSWIDLAKAVGIVWVVWSHVAEQLYGGPLFSNPAPGWGTLQDRLRQFRPISDGLWTVPANIIRWVGWTGDQGVQLFLIASGAGLAWGLLRSGVTTLRPLGFYRRRLLRVLPLWIGAHLAFLVPSILLQGELSLGDKRFWLSLVGWRVTVRTFYYFTPAWWYMTLLLQLYLVFPLLWVLLRRVGPARFLAGACVVGFAVRAAGLVSLQAYLDPFQRGSIFVTRLPEFAFGMALAAWIHARPGHSDGVLRSRPAVIGGLACYVVGFALGFTLLGMAVSPFLLGVGALHIVYLCARRQGSDRAPRRWHPVQWLSRHSLSLFLVHQPIVLQVVPGGGHLAASVIGRIALALALSVVAALTLEAMVGWVLATARRMAATRGPGRLVMVGVAVGTTALLVPTAAEALVRAHDPQEALGWGERPSLQPDVELGWKLRPSQTTHLRWTSYDYHVTANSLGFPGPQYPADKPPGTLRIMTVGDAFTSAEGVDTNLSWPRALERDLNGTTAGSVQVLNFAITGHGPNQEAAVLARYAPQFHPDVIIVQWFVWDYDEATTTNAQFQAAAGFWNPTPSSLRGFIQFPHLGAWFTREVKDRFADQVFGVTSPDGYSLGNFASLERGRITPNSPGAQILSQRYGAIASLARSIGAKVVVVAVPAPVQVCSAPDLAYFPSGVDLSDTRRFDTDQPQRVLQSVTAPLGVPVYDLRPVLQSAPACPYQPRNLHWTVAGQSLVATYLAGRLVADGVVAPTG